ncbi:bifunctional 5,10-methylene-tetrahydrofolate dehydrogenase/5,10-methylene-tetrahydrofolate cyclohydrolase [Modestobacter sp. VKM Ac-2676]|nr:bifunctional 5,10-methylene-tetrahydrofolate dehydrogenase/5,10-methylene-tetrahydrofolate cyclohydrolase [Modestobacter sp. VKM Ac-2676]
MGATLMDGKALSKQVRERTAAEVAEFTARTGRTPGLATVLVGDDPASAVYVSTKRKQCVAAGMTDHHRLLPATATQEEVAAVLTELAADPEVSGILLQLPLPRGLDSGALVQLIPAEKDVDGLTTLSAGLLAQGRPGLRPCTPSGVIELLDAHDVPLEGAEAVVIGRSELVGKPVAQLLLQRNATVTICHSRTRDLAEVCRRADVIVAAAGQPGLVQGDWVKDGAVVVDVGIHRTDSGLIGDVDTEAASTRASLITPVPGGVGPMTIAMLLHNTLVAARAQAEAG